MVRLYCIRLILDKDDNVIFFGISIPSLAKALQKSKGKLLPFGFIHLLKSLTCTNNVVDLYIVVFHPDYHINGFNASLFIELIPQSIANGY